MSAISIKIIAARERIVLCYGVAVTLSKVDVLSVASTWLQTTSPICTAVVIEMVTEPTLVQLEPLVDL
jgi:hypothetical protein